MSLSRSLAVRSGRISGRTGASCTRVALLLVCTGLALGGCSAAAPMANSGLISAFAAQPPPLVPKPVVDIEDDGREAQRPPRTRMYARPDDPTQPFSPNYGEVPLPQQPDDGEENPPAPV
jgi:hypothetical protein